MSPKGAEKAGTGAPTIYDVARLAGVSHQTVSRYLRGEQGIRPANRQAVVRALAELDYRPNLSARSLAAGRSRRVAVFTQEIGQIGPGRVLQGANSEARRAGYLLDFVTLDVCDREAIDDAIRQVCAQGVAGILAMASTDEMIAAFAATDFRVPAVVGAELDDARAGSSGEGNARGMDLLVGHLAGLGHRRFCFIGGPGNWVAARNRELAYTRALERRGLVAVGTARGDWSAASGYAAVRGLPLDQGVTAVVAANDQMALGAVLALTESGLSVPGDVSVTGMDDIAEAAYLSPPLTTVRLDFEEQGRDAFRRLKEQVDQGTQLVRAALVTDVALMVRASSGPAPD